MGFEKGKPRPEKAGRKAGTPNALTKTVKERVTDVFNELQQDPVANMLSWAKTETTEFYKIAAKLIPSELNAHIDNKIITVKVQGEEDADNLAEMG